MRRGCALYHQRKIVFADMMGSRLRGIQRPAVLQPGDLQRWVALADHADHVHPRAFLYIGRKAKRIDFRRYWKLQEITTHFYFITARNEQSALLCPSSFVANIVSIGSRDRKKIIFPSFLLFVLFLFFFFVKWSRDRKRGRRDRKKTKGVRIGRYRSMPHRRVVSIAL